MINYCVILAAINLIKYDWFSGIQWIIDVENYLVGLFTDNISFGCLMLGAPNLGNIAINSYKSTLVFSVFTPIILLVWCLFVLAFRACCKRTWDKLLDEFIGLTVITIWLLYPDVARVIFSSFSCVKNKDSSTRLFTDLEIMCWEGEHWNTIKYVSIPCIFIWIIGIPAFFF